METEEPQDRKRLKGGHYCIAIGCKNEFYRVKANNKTVNFHKLPLKRRTVLLRWLAALKRKNPPMGADSRVCSDHFLEEDYIEENTFESGKLVCRRTNRLKPEAAPSVFNFTTYNPSYTNRKKYSDNGGTEAAIHRSPRALKCASQAGERQTMGHLPKSEDASEDGHQWIDVPFSVTNSNNYSVQESLPNQLWTEPKAIVYESKMMELFNFCQICAALIDHKEVSYVSSQMKVQWKCRGGHGGTWVSYPNIHGMSESNGGCCFHWRHGSRCGEAVQRHPDDFK